MWARLLIERGASGRRSITLSFFLFLLSGPFWKRLRRLRVKFFTQPAQDNMGNNLNAPHTPKPPLSIEPLTRHEVPVALDWAKQEGWNPGIHDAACFYQIDPHGFFAAKLDGEIVGTISIVKYSEDFAFEGLVIVKPPFRGQGVGSALQAFANNVAGSLNLGLDGVLLMQSKYERAGFQFAHQNARYAGLSQGGSTSSQCIPIQKRDFNEVARFDAAFFPAPRPRFLECWLFQNDASALMMRHKQTDAIIGYGVIRKCNVGHKIGPLFAQNAVAAEALFAGLASTVQGQEVFLDVPQPNAAAVDLAERHGMNPVFATVRMYTKQAPSLPLRKIFGITSFELG
jgi:GNAT superfamily N-acetyltransferase